MADKNVHDRHPSGDEDFDATSDKKQDLKADGSKTAQQTRDDHFLETGVDAKGRSKEHFDAEGEEVDDDATDTEADQ